MTRGTELAGGLERYEAEDQNAAEVGIPDVEVFAALYERHLPGIYSYLLARTGREEDAADLAQQVFTQALAALPGYRQRGTPVSVWLFRIAHNLMVDFHRRRRPIMALEALPDTSHPPAGEDVEATVISREAHRRLGLVLAGLDLEKRDLLALRFAAGLTVREMAAVLGRREAAVRSELRRLLHTLQKELSDD